MISDSAESERLRLSARLKKLSAVAWVHEVDRIARFEAISIDEALTLLGRRFEGHYLESRRHIVWTMLEYVHVRLEPDAWADPLRCKPRRRSARASRGAAA
jgi:hypothetical protein